MKRFPVHTDHGCRPRDLPWWVPWDLVAPHEEQALFNHGQTLERLAERGGLSPQELWCVVHDKRWRERCDEAAAEVWLDGVACVCRACEGDCILRDVVPPRKCNYCNGSGWHRETR